MRMLAAVLMALGGQARAVSLGPHEVGVVQGQQQPAPPPNPVTERRKALLADLEDLKVFLPEDAVDPLTQRFQPRLQVIKEEASHPMRLERLLELQADFEQCRDELFAALYRQASDSSVSLRDPERFEEFMQKRMDMLVAIRRMKRGARVSQERLARLEGWKDEVGGLLDEGRMNEIWENLGKPRTAVSRLAVLGGTPRRQAGAVQFAGLRAPDFQPLQPTLGTNEPPLSPELVLASNRALASAESVIRKDILDTLDRATRRAYHKIVGEVEQIVSSVKESAHRFGNEALGQLVLLGVMKRETNFNRLARNPDSGAAGPMQFMPATGERFGIGGDLRYNIRLAVRAASKYLPWLLERYGAFDAAPGQGGVADLAGFFQWARGQDQQALEGNVELLKSGNKGERARARRNLREFAERIPERLRRAIAGYNTGEGNADKKRNDFVRTGAEESRNFVIFVLYNMYDYVMKTVQSAQTQPALA